MVTTGNENEFIIDLYERLHQTALKMKTNCNDDIMFEKLGVNPQSLFEFKSGIFKGNVDVDLGNLLSSFGVFNNPLKTKPKDGGFSMSFQMFESALSMLTNFFGKGVEKILNEPKSTAIAWLIVFIIIESDSESVKPEDWALLNLLSLIFAFHVSNHLLNDIPSMLLLDLQSLLMKFAVPKKEEEIANPDAKPQGWMNEDSIAVIVVMVSMLVGSSPRPSLEKQVFSFFKNVGQCKGGIVTMFSVVANLFKEFLMKISAPKCFLDFFNCKDVHRSVIEFHDRVTEFCIMCKNQEMNFEDLSMFFLTLRKDFADVSKFVTKDDKESHSYLAEARKRMESEYYGVKTRNDSLRGSRVEPVGIMLSGRPATLKSVLSHHLANALNHATLPDVLLGHFFDNPDMFKYSKGPDKFWDGYAPIANVTIFDDIFQARAVPGGSKEDSEAFNIIKTINTAEYALPIAVAENKGTSFFRSPFCIYTSNMEDVNAQEDIHSKEALRRRFHFWVKVELNEKYRDLLTSEAVLVHFPEDFWILNVTETIGAKLVDHGQIFASDFIKKIVSRAKVHQERFTKSQSKVCGLDINYNEIRSVYQNQKNHCELIDMETLERYESDHGNETDTGTIVPQGGEDPKKRKSFWRKIVPKKTKATFKITMDQEKQIPGYFSEKPSLVLVKHFDQKNAWNVVTQMVEIATGYEFSREQIISILDVMLNDHSNRLQLQTLRDQGIDRTMIVVQMIQCAVDQRTEENKDVYTGYDLEFWSRQWYNKISECFCDVTTIIVVVTTIRVMLRTIRLFLEFVTSYFMPEAVPQSGNEDRYVAPKATKKHGPPRIKVIRSEVKGNTPEGLWDDAYPKNDFNGLGLSRNASNDIVEKILKKNFFIMYYVDENEAQPVKKRIGHCVNLTGDFFMMPCHFINLLYPKLETPGDRDKKEVHFTVANNSRRFKMKLIDFLAGVRENEKLNDKDICLVQTHQEITAKGMFKYLISDKAPVKKRKNFNVSFYTLKQNDNHVTALLTKTTAKLKDEIHITDLWTKSKDNLNYIVEDVLEYPMQTVFGDCGSLIIVDDPNVGHEIVVGMHIAGKKSAGYCNIVTQEDFSDFMEVFGALSFKSEEQFPIVEDLERPVAQSGVFPDAIMHKDFKTPHASRTELTLSKIAGKIRIEGAVKHMPAMLRDFVRDGEVISPLQLALNKYNPDPVAINLHQAYLAGKNYFIKFQSCTRIEREVVPLRNALHHFGDHMNTIDSSSSGGWPFNTKVCDDLKKNYYSAVASGNVELIDMYYNEIDTLVTKAIAMYDRHERPAFVYVDNLKDEIRPVEKVREGKTRLFSGSPFIMLVMFRMYFGAFMDEFVHMNLDVGSAIGINPYGEDWDRLAKKLLFHSNNDVESECIGAGDYSAFDCSQQVEILNVIFHMIQTWYGGSDAHACYIRSMLWAEITSSRHVYDGKLYEWYSSLPSGNPMTAMINTMYNQIAFRYCWIQAGLNISDFNSNVVLIALGDDNIFSVSPWYRAAFNEMTLVHLMKSIGLKYTNETKGESVKPLRRLADVGFLKRGFRFEKEVVRWVGPISTVTISNLLDWTKKIDGDAITVEKAYTALRELSLHGKDVYDRYANQIIDNVQRYVTHIPPVNGWPIRWVDVLEEVCDIDHTVY